MMTCCVARAQQDSTKQKRFTVLPIVGFAPETSLLIGAGGFYSVKPSDSITRLSYINGNGIVTFNSQWQIGLGVNYFTKGEKYYWQGNFTYNFFPLYFYGVGDNINLNVRELFDSNSFRFQTLVYRQVFGKLFLGLGYRYGRVHRIGFEDNGILETLNPVGLNGNTYSGTQLGVLFDNRDSQLTPRKGWFLNFTHFYHREALGSQFNFISYQLDLRHYIKPIKSRRDVLAFQLVGNFNTGQVPFTELALLGGDNIMRGYYLGSYRDSELWAAQTEYRYRLNDKFGLVGFMGMGSVAPTFAGFSTARLLPNYGVGFRFRIIDRENVFIRIDYGRGAGTGNFYFGVSEAF